MDTYGEIQENISPNSEPSMPFSGSYCLSFCKLRFKKIKHAHTMIRFLNPGKETKITSCLHLHQKFVFKINKRHLLLACSLCSLIFN